MSSPLPIAAFLLTSLALPSGRQDDEVDPAPEDVVVPPEEELEPLHHEIFDRVFEGRVGCLSILVARDGEVIWEQGFGWARPGTPASSRTVYPVASVSKGLVGLAASLLVEDGELDLDAPVREVLSSFELATGPWVQAELRVRDLGRMTAAMPHGGVIWASDAPATAREGSWRAVRSFAVVDSEPGREFRYSNYTSGVLEAVVQDVSGESLDGFLRRRVFGPLGMGATRGLRSLEDPDLVQVRSNGEVLDEAPFSTPTGGQGFHSSVVDLYRLAQLHLDTARAEAIGVDPGAVAGSRAPSDGSGGYWMGWARFEHDGKRFDLSNGQGFDMTSCIVLCPEQNAAAICLTDTEWDGLPGGERLADAMAVRAMDAAVGGCREAYEIGIQEFEEAIRRTQEERGDPAPIQVEGTWSGSIWLEGEELAATMDARAGGSITLTFGEITATGRVQDTGGRLEGSLFCESRTEIFGESCQLTGMDLRLNALSTDQLGGSALISFSGDRAVFGSGGALVALSK